MRIVLTALCLLELLLVTQFRNFAGPYISPVLLLACSIAIALVFRKEQSTATRPIVENSLPAVLSRIAPIITSLAFLAFSGIIIHKLTTLWSSYKITVNDVDQSDIIPQIMVLVQRFVHHQPVYEPIKWHYSMFPTYLPMQWLPYVVAELAHKDYRWVPALVLWFSCAWFFAKNTYAYIKQKVGVLQYLLPLWPLLTWWLLIKDEPYTFVITVEELVAGYYLFTATQMQSKSVLPLVVGISLCLLSRYSIVLWVPLCIYGMYSYGYRKQAMQVGIGIVAVVLLCYVVPFLSSNPLAFVEGYQYHDRAALYDWNFGNYIFNGLGFGCLAVKLLEGTTAFKLHVYQKAHLVICLLVLAYMAFRCKKETKNTRLSTYLLYTFKIYISVFYCFIQTPYNYLFFVPLIVSAALLTADRGEKPVGLRK